MIQTPFWQKPMVRRRSKSSHRVEHGRRREGAAGPEALVPVLADDPGVAGRRVDPRLDPTRDLLEPVDAPQVDLLLLRAQVAEVAVGVDQARDRERRRAARRRAVVGPRNRSTSSRVTRRRRSPRARGEGLGPGAVGSPVQIRPTLRIRSAGPSFVQPQGPAGECLLGACPVGDRGDAVDEEVRDARGVAGRLVERGGVAERRRGRRRRCRRTRPARITPRSGRRRISAGRPEQRADRLLERR